MNFVRRNATRGASGGTWRMALVAVGMVAASMPALAGSAHATLSGTPAKFVPVTPNRILDTRTDVPEAADGPKGFVGAGASIKLQVTGRGGVPDGAVAVAMNLTATNAANPGFVTVWPSGVAQPEASNLNVERAGQTIANLAVVSLGTDGAVSLYSQSGADLIGDVSGYWVPATASTSGRMLPAKPTRVVDTRDGTGVALGKIGRDATITANLTSSIGGGYSAVVLNVTATNSDNPGFVTVWPGGGARPTVSNLNLERADQTIPNLAIVPLGADGSVNFYSQNGTDLVADVVGVFTDTSKALNGEGLFVPRAPERVADSRKGLGFGALGAGDTATLTLPGDPADFGAMLANVTATEATNKGYVTVWPGDLGKPNSSNLNVDRVGQTIPNLVISGTSPTGTVNLFSQSGTQLIVDLAGVFTKSPTITPNPPPSDDNPPASGRDRFHLFFVYPSDVAPPPASTTAAVTNEVKLFQGWLRTKTGGREVRITPPGADPDVFIYNLNIPTSQINPTTIYNGAVTANLVKPYEYAFFWVMGAYGGDCEDTLFSDSNHIGDRGYGLAGFIWLPTCGASTPSTASASFPSQPAKNAIEVMLQTVGVVPKCAPSYEAPHYLKASSPQKNDLFYEKPDAVTTSVGLDDAHTEYYGRPGCDISTDSVWRTP